MVNSIAEWISRLVTAWKFWVIVAPWEIGIRVRLGRAAIALLPGPHWRVPVLAQVVLVNTRQRVTSIPTVTLDSGEARCRCRKAIVGYRIVDPLRAVQEFEHPSIAVMARVQAEVASGAGTDEILEAIEVVFKGTGVEIDFLRFSEDVEAPALRLLQADWTVASENVSSIAGHY